MADKPLKWDEIVEAKPERELTFLSLYREVAAEVARRATEKAQAAFWPGGNR